MAKGDKPDKKKAKKKASKKSAKKAGKGGKKSKSAEEASRPQVPPEMQPLYEAAKAYTGQVDEVIGGFHARLSSLEKMSGLEPGALEGMLRADAGAGYNIGSQNQFSNSDLNGNANFGVGNVINDGISQDVALAAIKLADDFRKDLKKAYNDAKKAGEGKKPTPPKPDTTVVDVVNSLTKVMEKPSATIKAVNAGHVEIEKEHTKRYTSRDRNETARQKVAEEEQTKRLQSAQDTTGKAIDAGTEAAKQYTAQHAKSQDEETKRHNALVDKLPDVAAVAGEFSKAAQEARKSVEAVAKTVPDAAELAKSIQDGNAKVADQHRQAIGTVAESFTKAVESVAGRIPDAAELAKNIQAGNEAVAEKYVEAARNTVEQHSADIAELSKDRSTDVAAALETANKAVDANVKVAEQYTSQHKQSQEGETARHAKTAEQHSADIAQLSKDRSTDIAAVLGKVPDANALAQTIVDGSSKAAEEARKSVEAVAAKIPDQDALLDKVNAGYKEIAEQYKQTAAAMGREQTAQVTSIVNAHSSDVSRMSEGRSADVAQLSKDRSADVAKLSADRSADIKEVLAKLPNYEKLSEEQRKAIEAVAAKIPEAKDIAKIVTGAVELVAEKYGTQMAGMQASYRQSIDTVASEFAKAVAAVAGNVPDGVALVKEANEGAKAGYTALENVVKQLSGDRKEENLAHVKALEAAGDNYVELARVLTGKGDEQYENLIKAIAALDEKVDGLYRDGKGPYRPGPTPGPENPDGGDKPYKPGPAPSPDQPAEPETPGDEGGDTPAPSPDQPAEPETPGDEGGDLDDRVDDETPGDGEAPAPEPEQPDVPDYNALYLRAKTLRRREQYREAVQVLDSIEGHYDNNDLLYAELSTSLTMLGMHQRAMTACQLAMNQEGAMHEAVLVAENNMGYNLRKVGRDSEAKQYRALAPGDSNIISIIYPIEPEEPAPVTPAEPAPEAAPAE